MLRSWTRFIKVGVISATAMAAGNLSAQYNPRALVDPAGAITAPQPEAFAAQWPLEVDGAAGTITIFQPQMEELSGDTLTARSAVSIARQGGEPVYGVVWFKSRVSIDRELRMVRPVDVTITQARIPEADPAAEQAVREAIARGMTSGNAELGYEQLIEMLETRPGAEAALRVDAPRILFLERPAIKVQYDGEPRLMKAQDSTIERVVNTPFFVARDPQANRYYLKGGGVWYDATDAKGPFSRSTSVPPPLIALADQSGYKDPQEPLPAEQLERLEIITATEPTELIWTDGPPQMAAVPGTGLLYVTNSDGNMFVDVQSQRTYVLLSGRWYEAPNRNGPWAFVPPGNLPADFSKIPTESERGEVLAHIAGTPQARQAAADAQIPQTAAISRKDFEQPPIQYDGDPFFEPIKETPSLSYAVNTRQSVLQVGGSYYACHDAVWYTSSSPHGPWDLCTSVPSVVYDIPPSYPVYPVRYAHVYGYTPDYVYAGYTPGYVGTYVYDGVVVYGTGYHYRPWYGSYYYPRPYTYGFGARYSSYDGWGFAFGYGWGGGSLWIGYNSGYYGYSDPWFGYAGYRPYRHYGHRHYPYRYNYHHAHHDDRHDNWGRDERRAMNNRDDDRRGRANAFGNERNENARGDGARSANVFARRSDVQRVSDTSSRVRDTGRSPGQPPRMDPESRRNNVVADREGRVFRRAEDGNWQARSDGQWRSEGRTPAALANEPAARRVDRAAGRQPAASRAPEQRTAEARLANPGTPRVRSEDRTSGGSSEPRAGRIAPVERQPEVIRPRPTTPERQPQVQQRAQPAARSNPNIRETPSNQRTTRSPVVENAPRRSGSTPPLATPDVRREEPLRAPDRSSSGVRPGRVTPREVAPREPAPRVLAREPAPRVAAREPAVRSAPRESVRSAPPESRARVESRPAPRVEARSSASPRGESPSAVRSQPAPRPSGITPGRRSR